MMDILASEQLKIRTVRSTWYILAAVAAIIAISALAGWNMANRWDSLAPQQRAIFGFTPLVNLASGAASLCLAVLGVLAIATEHSTGTIQTTFTAVPRRGTVLAGKAVVVAVVATISGYAVAFGTFLASRLVEGQAPASADIPLLIASGLSVIMFSMMGLGLGALLRSATGAIGVLVALLYLLPTVTQNLRAPWNKVIGSLMPNALAGQLAGSGPSSPGQDLLLSPFGSLALMVLYAAAPLAAAAILIVRRDVR